LQRVPKKGTFDAILVLFTQSAQARPAKRKRAKRLGIFIPPLLHLSRQVAHDTRPLAHSKMSRIPHQISRAIEHRKKIWSTSSTCPQREQRWLPRQPLCFRDKASCYLIARERFLILRARSSASNSQTLAHTPLCVKKEYRDLVVKDFDLSRSHSNSSSSADGLAVCKDCISWLKPSTSAGVKLLRKVTVSSPEIHMLGTQASGSLHMLTSSGKLVFKGTSLIQMSFQKEVFAPFPTR
jgi:hypothetical protein